MKASKKEKKRLFIISILIIMLITLLISSTYKDWQKIFVNNSKTIVLKTKYEELIEAEKSLKSEATKLKDPDYVARYAKEKYLYSANNETIIRID